MYCVNVSLDGMHNKYAGNINLLGMVFLSNGYSMRPSVLCNIQAQARGRVACILHKTRGFLMLLCVLYHDDPLPTV